MVNCNPETVSTDYDTSDRLYFEPLTLEDVLEIVHVEKPKGLIVQYGGQTPLKLAVPLHELGVPIFGTTPDAIDRAEDRERFSALIEKLGLRQPENGDGARAPRRRSRSRGGIGYPVMVRPSYVLGGRAMEVVYDDEDLETYLREAVQASNERPVLVDRFLRDAAEVDVDVVSDGKDVVVGGVMEHIEEAGIHSGDSACALPPFSLAPEVVARDRAAVDRARAGARRRRAHERPVRHPGEGRLRPRGEPAREPHRAVRRQGDRPAAREGGRALHGREDARGGGRARHAAAEARLREGGGLPVRPLPRRRHDARAGDALDRRGDGDRPRLHRRLPQGAGGGGQRAAAARARASGRSSRCGTPTRRPWWTSPARSSALGFEVLATAGTSAFFGERGIPTTLVKKVHEGRPSIVDRIKDGDVHFVVNTTAGKREIADSYSIRRETLMKGLPYFTTLTGARARRSARWRRPAEGCRASARSRSTTEPPVDRAAPGALLNDVEAAAPGSGPAACFLPPDFSARRSRAREGVFEEGERCPSASP